MKFTDNTVRALKIRREHIKLKAEGWERVGEGGGELWRFQRGDRLWGRITDVRIAADEKSLWIKFDPGDMWYQPRQAAK